MKRLLWVALLLAVLPVWAAACGGGNGPVNNTPTVAVTSEPATATAEPDLPGDDINTELDSDAESTELVPARPDVVLPDPTLTPGDVLDVGADRICVSGYSSSVRNVSTSKRNAVYAEYNILTHAPGQYEVDHLVPLELGGSNDIKNLWPQPAEPRPGFHEKDRLENKLHHLVCDGTVGLTVAQQAIAGDWYSAYVLFMLAPTVVPAPTPTLTTSATPPAAAAVTFVSVAGAAPGGQASVTVRTTPGASCSISYVTPAGSVSQANGLSSQTADTIGQASWTWSIGPSTTPGSGTVTVTCDGLSASSPIQIG